MITLVGEAGDAGDVPAEHGPALVELVHLEARVPPVHLPAAQRGVGGRRPRPLLLVEVSAAFMHGRHECRATFIHVELCLPVVALHVLIFVDVVLEVILVTECRWVCAPLSMFHVCHDYANSCTSREKGMTDLFDLNHPQHRK